MGKRAIIISILFISISTILFSSIIPEAFSQTIVSGHKPDGIVYKHDERIYIVQHTGYSMLEGVEGQFAADSIIYGDIINVSDDTVYYIIIRGNVYKDQKLWEKTGYGQAGTFRYDYPSQIGNPTELAISPYKLTLRPGEAAPFSLWPGQSGWDCYELWIESYELENKVDNIIDERMRNDVIIKSGELDKKGTYRGKVFNPTEKTIGNVNVILVKYDANDKIFAILGDSVGSLSPNKSSSFEISAYIPGYPITTHTENLLYGKAARLEVLGWGYSAYRGQDYQEDYDEKHSAKLFAVSQYFPNEDLPKYMNFEEIKEKAAQDVDKSAITDFCTKPKQKEEVTISSGVSVPNWIKNNARWWANNEITDQNFVTSIEYLINQRIIKLDTPEPTEEEKRYQSDITTPLTQDIPAWVKNNAKWWAENKISTNDFISGIKYLVEQGIIKI